MGLLSSVFLIPAIVWSQIMIRCCTTNLHIQQKIYKIIIRLALTQNQSKTPSVIFCWKSYTSSEKMYISEC